MSPLKKGLNVSKSQHAWEMSGPDGILHRALAGASEEARFLPYFTASIENRPGEFSAP
jgi:hypothetical protein